MDRSRRPSSRASDDAVAVALQPLATSATPTATTGRSAASPARSANSNSNSNTNRVRRRRPPPADRNQPSIRLRRFPSSTNLRAENSVARDFAVAAAAAKDGDQAGNRRRSSSEPQRMHLGPNDALSQSAAHSASGGGGGGGGRPRGLSNPMPCVDEEAARSADQTPYELEGDVPVQVIARPGIYSRASTAARSALGISAMGRYNDRRRANTLESHDEYEDGLVDYLDVVDPEIATLSTLTNVQNSLFVPNLGSFLNRRPTYTFTRNPSANIIEDDTPNETPGEHTETDEDGERPMFGRSVTITSRLSDTEDHYAVLPHGIKLKGWSVAEKQELNDHVRHMLHSRRAAFKRSMKGFGQYVRRPLGFFVTLYAFLITAFGLLWVLFLIGWISVGGKQDYDINVIDNVLVALFAVMGDGLIPFRTIDTYHMIYIAHYHHLTWKLRKKKNLPELKDHNDLPGLQPKFDEDVETASADADDYEDDQRPVLNEEQQRKLKHHQDKFSKSHTFYKPHETDTHRAFPLRLLVAIVVLLDFHSIFQVALGTCTWAISYHVRPQALTTVILCCSLTCNITGGILISIGDKRTRKKEVVEKMFRQKLTEQAMHKIEKRRKLEQQRNADLAVTVGA